MASSVFLAFYDLSKKASVRGNAVLPVLLVSTFFGACVYVTVLAGAGGIGSVMDVSARDFALIDLKPNRHSSTWVLLRLA